MSKIEPYKEQPERIPDEKIEIVFHQGERLGPCFGEHPFDFSPGDPPSHFNCNSSRDFVRQTATVSKAERKAGQKIADHFDALIREAFLK